MQKKYKKLYEKYINSEYIYVSGRMRYRKKVDWQSLFEYEKVTENQIIDFYDEV